MIKLHNSYRGGIPESVALTVTFSHEYISLSILLATTISPVSGSKCTRSVISFGPCKEYVMLRFLSASSATIFAILTPFLLFSVTDRL